MKTLLYANRAEPKSISVISILLLAAVGAITKLRCMHRECYIFPHTHSHPHTPSHTHTPTPTNDEEQGGRVSRKVVEVTEAAYYGHCFYQRVLTGVHLQWLMGEVSGGG